MCRAAGSGECSLSTARAASRSRSGAGPQPARRSGTCRHGEGPAPRTRHPDAGATRARRTTGRGSERATGRDPWKPRPPRPRQCSAPTTSARTPGRPGSRRAGPRQYRVHHRPQPGIRAPSTVPSRTGAVHRPPAGWNVRASADSPSGYRRASAAHLEAARPLRANPAAALRELSLRAFPEYDIVPDDVPRPDQAGPRPAPPPGRAERARRAGRSRSGSVPCVVAMVVGRSDRGRTRWRRCRIRDWWSRAARAVWASPTGTGLHGDGDGDGLPGGGGHLVGPLDRAHPQGFRGDLRPQRVLHGVGALVVGEADPWHGSAA